jgi:hypothetical protein
VENRVLGWLKPQHDSSSTRTWKLMHGLAYMVLSLPLMIVLSGMNHLLDGLVKLASQVGSHE